MGFGELLLILLAFGGFGVKANPNAPTHQQVARYAVDDADALVFIDLEAVVPHNWDYFVKLPSDPTIKSVPALAGELGKAIKQVEDGRAMIRAQLGMDLVTDLKWGAIWIRLKAKGEPDFLAVGAGKFPADFIDKGAAMGKKKVTKLDGKSVLEEDNTLAGLSGDGMFVFGTPALVKPRLAASWKGANKAGSVTDRAGEFFADRPFFVAAFRPSPVMVKTAGLELNDTDELLVRDFVVGHEFFGMLMTANSFGWTSVLRTPGGYGRALMASEGTIQLIRAGHLFLRGITQVFLASIDSFVSADPSIAKVIKHKADLLKLVNSWTGDGNFAVKLDKDEPKRRVAVRLTGKTLAEVFPVGALIVPGAAAALWMIPRAAP